MPVKRKSVAKRKPVKKTVAKRKPVKKTVAKRKTVKRVIKRKQVKRGGTRTSGEKSITERDLIKLVKEKGLSKKILKMVRDIERAERAKKSKKCETCFKVPGKGKTKKCERCGDVVCKKCIIDDEYEGEVCELCSEWLEERRE